MLCDRFHNSSDYVFTRFKHQSYILDELDSRVYDMLSENSDGECGDLMARLLCHYFVAPCGANRELHLPLSVCPDECNYVQSACPIQWSTVNNILTNAQLSTIKCAAGSLLQGLAPCCIDAGIKKKYTFVPLSAKTFSHFKMNGYVNTPIFW